MLPLESVLERFEDDVTSYLVAPFWDARGIFRVTVTVMVNAKTTAVNRRHIRNQIRDYLTHARMVKLGRNTEIGRGYYDFETRSAVRVVTDRRRP